MIGQYLSNTNESGTIPILQKNFGTKQGLHQDLHGPGRSGATAIQPSGPLGEAHVAHGLDGGFCLPGLGTLVFCGVGRPILARPEKCPDPHAPPAVKEATGGIRKFLKKKKEQHRRQGWHWMMGTSVGRGGDR